MIGVGLCRVVMQQWRDAYAMLYFEMKEID